MANCRVGRKYEGKRQGTWVVLVLADCRFGRKYVGCIELLLKYIVPFGDSNIHTLLPAIETTDAIGNTENKQVKRNMSKYIQRMFMLISLSLGYLFYDTYSYFL